MRIYVIGPVTGMPSLNRAAFERAREALEAAGHSVSVPHDFVPPSADHERAMRMSFCWMLVTGGVEGVAMLDGWEGSPGACVEMQAAEACGVECREVDGWL